MADYDPYSEEESYIPAEYTPPEESSPQLSASLPSGIDAVVNRRIRQKTILLDQAARNPVYQTDYGFVKKMPGFVQTTAGPVSFGQDVPYQAQEAEKIFVPTNLQGTPVSDRDIFQNRETIFQSLMDGAGGELNDETFYNNPHWERIRSQGIDEEMLGAIQRSTLRAVAPIYKQFKNEQSYATGFNELVQDEETGMMARKFLEPFVAELSQPGSPQALNALRSVKDKVEFVKNNPLVQEQISSLSKSKDRDDINTLQALMLSKSVGSMASILKDSQVRIEKRNDRINSLYGDLQEKTMDIEGPISASVKQFLSDKIEDGSIKYSHQLNTILNSIIKSDKDLELPGGITIPSIRGEFIESELVRKIKDRSVFEGEKNLAIDGDGKIINTEDMRKVIDDDVKVQLGDVSFKGNGKYIEVPKDKFVDSTGKTIFLGTQWMNPKTGQPETIPTSIVYEDRHFVLRSELEKMGFLEQVENKKLKDEQIQLGPGFSRFVSPSPLEFKPAIIPAELFLSMPAGQRLVVTDEKGQERKVLSETIQSIRNRYDAFERMGEKGVSLMDQPSIPSVYKELHHGAERLLLKAGLEMGMAIPATLNTIKNGLLGAAYQLSGDNENADKYYSAALGETELGTIDRWFGTQATLKDRLAETQAYLEQNMGPTLGDIQPNPEAEMSQKIAGILGEGLGGFAGMMAELQTMGFQRASAKAAEYLAGLTKYGKEVGAFSKTFVGMPGQMEAALSAKKKFDITATILRMPFEAVALAGMAGRTSPSEIGGDIAAFELMGASSLVGRGFRLPSMQLPVTVQRGKWGFQSIFRPVEIDTTVATRTGAGMGALISGGEVASLPMYMDKMRAAATTAAFFGQYGLGAAHQWLEGKSGEEIVNDLGTPERAAEYLSLAIMGAYGQKVYRTEKLPPMQLPSARPGIHGPVRPVEAPKYELAVIQPQQVKTRPIMSPMQPRLGFTGKDPKRLEARQGDEWHLSEIQQKPVKDVVDFLNAVGENPNRSPIEAAKYNAALYRLQEFKKTPEFEKESKAIKENIVGLLGRLQPDLRAFDPNDQKLATKQDLITRAEALVVHGQPERASGELVAVVNGIKEKNLDLPTSLQKLDLEVSEQIKSGIPKEVEIRTNEIISKLERISEDAKKTAQPDEIEELRKEASGLAVELQKINAANPTEKGLSVGEIALSKLSEAKAKAYDPKVHKFEPEKEGQIARTAEEKAALRKRRGWDFIQKRRQDAPLKEIRPGVWQANAQLFERPKTRDSVTIKATNEAEARAKASEIFDERHSIKKTPHEVTSEEGSISREHAIEESDARAELIRGETSDFVESKMPVLIQASKDFLKPKEIIEIKSAFSEGSTSPRIAKYVHRIFKESQRILGESLSEKEIIDEIHTIVDRIDSQNMQEIGRRMLSGEKVQEFKLYERSRVQEHESFVKNLKDEIQAQKESNREQLLSEEMRKNQELSDLNGCGL